MILAAAKTKTAATPEEIVALQTEMAEMATELKTLKEGTAREKAEGYVDGEIKRGRVGLKPVRERYIALHMSDPDGAKALIEAMPLLGPDSRTVLPAQPAAKGEVALQSEQQEAARLLGIDPKDYAEAVKADNQEAL